jgi:hypothetical protein
MTQTSLDFTAGEALKEAGMSVVLANADVVNFNWTDYALSLLGGFAKSVEKFSSDEFRAHFVDRLPDPPSPNAFGALFNRAAKAGIIRHVGYAKSCRAAAHRRVVGVWCAA